MLRTVTPELLDSLPADAPEARRSRRDLEWINRCLGSAGWFRRQCARLLRPGDRVLELGAGENRLHRCAPPGVVWDAIDLAPRPPHWPPTAEWHQEDVRTFDRWARYTVLVGNLVFHHLTDAELAALGRAARPHVRLLLAHEPHRSRAAQRGFALLCGLIGADAVTRHDGRVSIAAGFRGDELAHALGCNRDAWSWRESPSLVGTHRLILQRR